MRNVTTALAAVMLMGFGPMAFGQQSHEQPLSRDQLRAAVQEICPVSGNKLGSHGPPVKVQVGEETVFLCCKACLQKEISREHWATIHANAAEAQRICPVMKNPLPENPKWTIVEGQIVYVCCPPCTKKVEADPATYLKQIDALYRASLEAEPSR